MTARDARRLEPDGDAACVGRHRERARPIGDRDILELVARIEAQVRGDRPEIVTALHLLAAGEARGRVVDLDRATGGEDTVATARPVIVTERSTLRDYVRPDETVVTVPAEDPAALRDAIRR